MKNQIGQIIIVFLLSAIYQSCKNKDCHKTGECPPEYYRIRLGELKNYLWTLPGSYWIYKNSLTGDLDTQVCNFFTFDSIKSQGTLDNSKHIHVENDFIKRQIESSFTGFIYFDQTAISGPDLKSFNNGVTVLYKTLTNDIGVIKPLFYPFTDGLINGTGSSYTNCKGMDSTLIIQGKTYYNVAKFDIDQDDIWFNYANYPNAVYYWAKDVGLIKRFNKTENFS